MPSNFLNTLQKIKKQDVEVLLKKAYRGIWETAIKKYSDSAHFVYELLQNADDAKATWVEFNLEAGGLWFKHNGTVRFSISDPETEDQDAEKGKLGHINAITSIGNSTKIDEQKIGKFGIGFKAVFAYSLTPHVYDDSINFKLENYIVPAEIPSIGAKRKPGETLFYFPFNHKDKPQGEAYLDIEEKFCSLFQPILFLSHLERIKWQSIVKKGEYSRKVLRAEPFNQTLASLMEVSGMLNGTSRKEQIWLFSRKAIHPMANTSHQLAIGYFLTDTKMLKTGRLYDAFCFFPTKEETKLGFIIQAPFLLTDNREGIKAGDPWNVELINQLAVLAADSLPVLKMIGTREKTFLLNDSLLDLIPYRPADFPEVGNKAKISFRPFYTSILKKLSEDELLPGRNGRYLKSSKAYWVTDPELADLFSDQQISELMIVYNAGLVFVTKGQKQLNQANKPLEAYISSLVVDVLDAKKLLRRFTAKFIESQTDEWLLKLYAYLGSRRFLWDDKDRLALRKPILLNQDRKAVTPYNEAHDTPNIFLATGNPTSYSTIYKPFMENKEAVDFFHSLGIGQPDLRIEILSNIIPQYYNSFDYGDKKKLLLHLESFLTYYGTCSVSMLNEFVKKLKEVPFLASLNPAEPGMRYFCQPELVYFGTDKLTVYFGVSKSAHLLDEQFYSEFFKGKKKELFEHFLRELGVGTIPKLQQVELAPSLETQMKFSISNMDLSQKFFKKQLVTDKVLDGLEEAIAGITPERSVIIWDFLLAHLQGKSTIGAETLFSGSFQFLPKSQALLKVVRFDSTLTRVLKTQKWLYNNDGRLVAVEDMRPDTLSRSYNLKEPQAEALLEYLGIKNPDGDLDLTAEQKQALALGRKLLDEGITQDEINEVISILAAKKRAAASTADKLHDKTASADHDLDQMMSKLKKDIRKKRTEESADTEEREQQLLLPEPEPDQDDFSKPSVDLQRKIEKLKEQTEAQIEDLTRIEKLNEVANQSEKYSYAWFKALLELEYLNSSDNNPQNKAITIQFTKVEKEAGSERILVLKHPNRYIPQSIEDIGDLQIRLYEGDSYTSVTVEVVSVKEYTLRAKLKKSADDAVTDISKISRAVVDVKNPVFILDELRKSFNQLGLPDEANLQKNLTENIRFVFGPPGTGKTTHLATEEIIPLMKRKKELKVLVLTPTNKAADVLTRRIIEKMGTDETYHHWLLRFGTTGDAELEAGSLVVDKTFDITSKSRNTVVTTVARFAYDYFQPAGAEERRHLKFLHWDYIIIDEASMVNLASVAYVLYQKPQASFIIAGDPFQIQPITQIEQWKDLNIYSMVQLDRFVAPVTVPHPYKIKNLHRQYRAIPSIGNVFSHFTYNGILEHHRRADEQKPLKIPGLAFKDITIIKFPVSKHESIYKPNTLNKSNYQVYSSIFTVEFVQQLVRQITKTHKDSFRIGIICPYRAQATLIEKLLAQQEAGSAKAELMVGTIHGFQGDECDIIISLFNPPFNISRSPAMFLNKQNILNVSISRARDYLFILMPDDATPDVENLYKIKQIENLAHSYAAERLAVFASEEIEEKMFGSKTYVYDNAFATSHQSVNVYTRPEKKYEVRCEDVAVDVQIRQEFK